MCSDLELVSVDSFVNWNRPLNKGASNIFNFFFLAAAMPLSNVTLILFFLGAATDIILISLNSGTYQTS